MNSINSGIIQKFPCSGRCFVTPFYQVLGQYRKEGLIDNEQLVRGYYMTGEFFMSWARNGISETATIFECDASFRSIMYDAAAKYYFSMEAIADYCIFSREHTMSCNFRGNTRDRIRKHRATEKYNFIRDLPIYFDYMQSRQKDILENASQRMYNYILTQRVTERFFETLTYIMRYCQQDNIYDESIFEKSQTIMDRQEAMGLDISHSTVLGPAPPSQPRRAYSRTRQAIV